LEIGICRVTQALLERTLSLKKFFVNYFMRLSLIDALRRIYKFALFGHVTPTIVLGSRHILSAKDMPDLHIKFAPQTAIERIKVLSFGDGRALLFSLIKSLRKEILAMLLVLSIATFANLVSPLLIHRLISFVANAKTTSLYYGFSLALLLSLSSMTYATLLQHYYYMVLGNMQLIINGLNHHIYLKTLKISRYSQQKRATGDVVNLMGTDSDAVAEFIFAASDLLFAAITIVVVIAMLFSFLGVAALAGLFAFIFVIPITRYLVRRFTKLDEQLMQFRDQRVSLVSQVLSGIRIVKYFAWGDKMLKEIDAIRKQEILCQRKLANSSCISLIIYFTGSTLVGVAAFTAYIWQGQALDAATIFSCVALFSMLDGPLGSLSDFISKFTAAFVSANRISEYLRENENCNIAEDLVLSDPNKAFGVRWENYSAKYIGSPQLNLERITAEITAGESVAIVGTIGGGKSSLLLSLLDEIPCEGGSIIFPELNTLKQPRFAYVPQEAFTLNGTIKENIVFGAEGGLSDSEIDSAIFSAVFDQDIKTFNGELDAEIGEHGINLSGGQKQRLALARAVAASPGMVLLDDPLSAVDHATEDLLAERLIFGKWKDITRIVVTHRLKHLHRFDRIIFLDRGSIVAQGSLMELMRISLRFCEFYAEHSKKDEADALSENLNNNKDSKIAPSRLDVFSNQNSRITEDEDRESGAVNSKVYLKYLHAMAGEKVKLKPLILPILVLSTLVVTLIPILQNAWLAVWTNQLVENNDKAALAGSWLNRTVTAWLAPFVADDLWNVFMYGLLGLLVILAALMRQALWLHRAITACQHLHDTALAATLKASLRFFDSTPIGRILNRFSRDVDSTGWDLSWAMEHTVRGFFSTLASILVLVTLVPIIIVVILPMLYFYAKLQSLYRAASREVQRLTSIARSPRFAHFKETLNGLIVIRAYKRQNAFAATYQNKLHHYQSMFHSLVIFNRWFSIRIPLLAALITFAVTLSIIYFSHRGAILAGTAGLALMYSLRFWEALNWSVRSFSQMEAKMTSVERLSHYASLPAEVEVIGTQTLAANIPWPAFGHLQFENVTARYAQHLPDILKNVSFSIPAGSKTGFIGRTGAGKSTLFQVLYRFINQHEGRILIDGIDTRSIPLDRLRRALAIIPQDPTLFSGTLRSNIDRFEQHSDANIWQALRRAHLEKFVRHLPGQLNTEVKENGNNFSQGQRQLFCLARALLIDAKIIVMDEATASVDVETDQLIQQTIQNEFHGKTKLIIAHRLNSLRDCDLIIELTNGHARVLNNKEVIKDEELILEPTILKIDQSIHTDSSP
jgi:ABC-type multidrug transport system fused ATPase/permease subunit